MERQKNGKFVKKLPTIIGITVCVILAPILIMNLTIVIKSYTYPNKVPDFFGIMPFVVTTGSMNPAIRGGDLVISKKVKDKSKLKPGDVISFKEGKAVVTHRILELAEKNGEPVFITGGDANKDLDGNVIQDNNPVTYSQVAGIYKFKVRGLGNLAMFLQTAPGMLVFVGIPLCGFIAYDIIRRRLAMKKQGVTADAAQAEIDRLKAELAAKEEKKEENDENANAI